MNQIMLRFSNKVVLIGVCTLIITHLINHIMPVIGYVAYQAAAKGSYLASAYHIQFRALNVAAIILIILGLGLGHIVYRKEQGYSLFPMPQDGSKK